MTTSYQITSCQTPAVSHADLAWNLRGEGFQPKIHGVTD